MGRIFVAGSINMDVVATADRHPGVGETVAGHTVRYFPGGKGANQAVAAAKLGSSATLIGRLGNDEFGRDLLELVDILILNETELGLLAKTELRDSDDHARFIDAMGSLGIGKDKIICVTLGKRGVLALIDDEPLRIPGRAVEAVDTT